MILVFTILWMNISDKIFNGWIKLNFYLNKYHFPMYPTKNIKKIEYIFVFPTFVFLVVKIRINLSFKL